MNTFQEITIDKLKKLIEFLEKRWIKSTCLSTSPINSLAPRILTDEKEILSVQPYLNSLKQAIETKGVNNIAITGSYGSGKSTILNTFQHLNPEYEYLNISLASFRDNKGKSDEPEFERRLEISILQQMFYHVEPSQIPDSRFKRIVNITHKKLIFYSLFFILWSFSALILFKFNHVEKLNPDGWNYNHPINWITVLASLFFSSGIGILVKSIYRLFKNSKINKLSIKGELELGEAIDKSVFNQHLEEILYFFERTEFNVVIIEDVDRFDSTDIFTKLREINILINHSNLITRPVKFVYAIKDEMFKDKNERVKFFEFIIPVIPFINPSNASDQLTKLINYAQLQEVLSTDFTSDVVTFIDDIDMRLLINIFHEYILYRSILSRELKQDNLFAIIVYKNLYPDDFGDLQRRKGNLYNFFYNKPAYIKKILEQYKTRIEEIGKHIELIDNEADRPIKELRAVYVTYLVSKLDNFYSFYFKDNISIIDALEDECFENIKSSSGFFYTRYENYYYGNKVLLAQIKSPILFKEIEKEVSNKLTYKQREKILQDKANGQINILKTEKEKIKQGINEIESKSIHKLFKLIDIEEHLGSFKDNNLMRNLLLNGYIDEHYGDYISLFHGINLTKEDFVFERNVKSGYSLPFEYALIKIENLVKRLPDHYFRKEEIFNYNLLSFLLENERKHKDKMELLFKCLSLDGDKQFEFMYGFIKNKPQSIHIFTKLICFYKPGIWQYVHEKSGLPEAEIKGLLNHIFNYADKNSIFEFNSLESLVAYITHMKDFFEFCFTLKHTNTIQSFITERKVKFENLDLPHETQKQLFEVVYTKNLYQLNLHNIFFIIKGNGVTVDESKLKVAHYTTLLESGLENLLSYIDDFFEDYIEQVFLLAENNKDENEKTIIDILNREELSLDLKTQVVRSQNGIMISLNSIDDIEVKQILLENNKVAVNWDNVFNYYDSTEIEEFDEVLISFLNEQENYEILSRQKLNKKGREEEYGKKISNTLLHSEALEINAYTDLLNSLPYKYSSVSFEKLEVKKIEALLSKKILTLTSENFDGLKLKDSELHIKIIEVHQDEFVEQMDKLSLDSNDWLLILKSSSIKASNKQNFIKSIEDSVIINNKSIADVACHILPNDQYIPLSYEVLYAMFDVHNSLSKKIALLYLNLGNLNDVQIQALIEKMGEEYAKIFMKQHKPYFPNDPHHIALFEKLHTRDLIIRYEVNEKKNVIKVFAKY